MKAKPGPILSLVLLAGLGTWAYFKEFRGAEEGRKAEEMKDKVMRFERAAVKAIRIQNAMGAVRLQKEGEAWTITEPLSASADKEAVDGLLSSLDMARIERRLGEGISLKDYHLDPPAATVTVELTSGAAPEVLSVGDSNPIGGTYFALPPGGKEVAVVSASAGEAAKKDLQGLRDKSVLAFDPWKVKRVRIERGKERILLMKPEDGWKIQEPIEAPADGPAVNDLLNALERLRVTTFPVEKPAAADLKRYGLLSPAARLTILQDGWDVEKSIRFGKDAGNGRYVRTEGRDPVMLVPGDVWSKVNVPVSALRRKEILGLSQYRVENLTAAVAGEKALVLSRQKDRTWKASGLAAGTVQEESVDALVRAIGEMKAQSWDDHPSEPMRSALARRPALDLTLQQEPDAPGGTARTQHLVIGPADSKGRIKVRDMAWRPIPTADGATLAKIKDQLRAIAKEAAEPPKAAESTSPEGDPAGTAPPPAAPSEPAEPKP